MMVYDDVVLGFEFFRNAKNWHCFAIPAKLTVSLFVDTIAKILSPISRGRKMVKLWTTIIGKLRKSITKLCH